MSLENIEGLITEQSNIIHSCLHFAAEANTDRTQALDPLPPDLAFQQSKLISCLNRWLSSYHDTLSRSSSAPPDLLSHLEVLKARTIAMLITISCLPTTTEMIYDKYASSFQEIIRCCEGIIPVRQQANQDGKWGTLPAYTPSIGIVMPLYVVARKYRHSLWRRRAIKLLYDAGLEGPFNGEKEAAVAEHIVSVEENRPFKATVPLEDIRAPEDILEERRVWGCWRVRGFEEDDVSKRQVVWCCHKDLVGVESMDYVSQQEDEDWIQWEESIVRRLAKGMGRAHGAAAIPTDVQEKSIPLRPGGEVPMRGLDPATTRMGSNHAHTSYWTHPTTSRRRIAPSVC